MSRKQRRETPLFLFAVTLYLHMFRACFSVSLGQREDGVSPHWTQDAERGVGDLQQGGWRLVEEVIPGENQRPVSKLPPSPDPEPADGYQADSTAFDGVPTKMKSPLPDSSPHLQEWLALRPVLQCDDQVMVFTASGEGLAHLLVDRGGASPISLFQLPSYCGYSVRTSWSDIEMMVPYDACYITQENGSYVLPLLWWGSPLKLSCPIQMASPASSPRHPAVFCSPHGMVVQMDGQEQDIVMLGFMVNGRWGPFVSEDCAYRTDSKPGELAFFVTHSAPCITKGDGLRLHLVFDEQEYSLSCPSSPRVSPSPGDAQIPHFLDPITTVPTPSPTPKAPTKEQLPDSSYHLYPAFQFPQLPQVYPPGPQPALPPKPTPGSAPGSQPEPQQQQQQQVLPLSPKEPEKLPHTPGDQYPFPPYQAPGMVQVQASSNQWPQYGSGVYYPSEDSYSPSVKPAPTAAPTQPPSPHQSPYHPHYYIQKPHHPQPPAAPETQAPAPPPPPTPKVPTQQHMEQLPESFSHLYTGFQFLQLPQIYPLGPQPALPSQPGPGSAPGSQPEPQQQQQQVQPLSPKEPEKLPHTPGDQYPSPPYQAPVMVPAQASPNQWLQYGAGVYYPSGHMYYPSVKPAPTAAAAQPPSPQQNPHHPHYYIQKPHHPQPPAAPETQAPAPPPPPTPKVPTQQHMERLPDSFNHVLFQFPQFPGSQPEPHHHQQQQQLLPLSPKEPEKPYTPGLFYPSEHMYYPSVKPAPTAAATQPPSPQASLYYPHYYIQKPHHPQPTAAPETQAPSPPPKQPVDPQQPLSPYYPPNYYSYYYQYGHYFYPHPGFEVQPSPAAPTTIPTITTTRTMIPKQPASPSVPIYPQKPYVLLPTPVPPPKEKPHTAPQEPQKPVAPQVACPSYSHSICGYYPVPYHPYYYPFYQPPYQPPHQPPYQPPHQPPHQPPYQPPHQPYPAVPQYPQVPTPVSPKRPPTPTTTPSTTTTTTTTTTTAAAPPSPSKSEPRPPHLQCLTGRMVAFLPYANPGSIQVRDHGKTWMFLSSVSSLCGYKLQMAELSGVILQAPLPACHSEPRSPTTISLPVRFWDLSISEYRTLDLQCPYQAPTTAAPSVSPATPSPARVKTIPKPEVFCSPQKMTVVLPPGPISALAVKDIKGNQMNLQDTPKHCGYSARKGKDGKIHLSLQLHSSCYMSVQGKTYIITVVYMTANGRREGQFSCPDLILKSGQECSLPSEQRLPCGLGSVSQPQCHSMGCCFSRQPPACYYPMDECTIDRHFVFSVPATLTNPPLSPALLVAAGNSSCKPARVTADYALFKIPMDGCGTRSLMVGKTMIYMVEVVNKVQSISLNYGTITRDSPVRFLVECRYLPSPLLSVSYMVKTPSLGPALQTQGVFGVQLRIAKDAQYSSYHPQYHQPLQMLLGKPLYLEVRLINTADPSLVLLVHFCVAYPRSGKAVWLLLYNGCPNPLDPAPQQALVFDPTPPSPPAQTRRFTISTFQFLPDGEFKDPDEEIYFMCSTEICSPRDGPCVEGCFGQ